MRKLILPILLLCVTATITPAQNVATLGSNLDSTNVYQIDANQFTNGVYATRNTTKTKLTKKFIVVK